MKLVTHPKFGGPAIWQSISTLDRETKIKVLLAEQRRLKSESRRLDKQIKELYLGTYPALKILGFEGKASDINDDLLKLAVKRADRLLRVNGVGCPQG